MLGLKLNHVSKWATDSKTHGANMGPNWGRQDPGGPHVDPMNLAIWDVYIWILSLQDIVVCSLVFAIHCTIFHNFKTARLLLPYIQYEINK